MIYSPRASSSVIPRKVDDLLGIKYELVSKGVVQFDDIVVKTVGVIKDLNLTLHACLGCIILQDISIIELSILSSTKFTIKMGGYLSSNWSQMLFNTRYGTKVTIKSKPIIKHHIEPYTLGHTNMNYTLHEEWNECIVHERFVTLLEEVLDCLLDEWRNSFYFDPYIEVEETRIGTYYIHEENTPIPSVMKTQGDLEGLWCLFFYRSRNNNGVSASVMLISPSNENYVFSFRLQFSYTTNMDKYESLIQCLWIAQK